ncbi:MAG: hypothetical protein QNL05_03105 [Gammaproteobacteria bacterium]|nr:hypothetical protein [Gammaproteobacteria bacterium]MDX2486551.1 hypothetical protein [Gammaproteobacteria bacterium]
MLVTVPFVIFLLLITVVDHLVALVLLAVYLEDQGVRVLESWQS